MIISDDMHSAGLKYSRKVIQVEFLNTTPTICHDDTWSRFSFRCGFEEPASESDTLKKAVSRDSAIW